MSLPSLVMGGGKEDESSKNGLSNAKERTSG